MNTGISTIGEIETMSLLLGAAGLVTGAILMALLRYIYAMGTGKRLDMELETKKQEAEKEAAAIRLEAEKQAQKEMLERKEAFERETDESRKYLRGEEKRLSKREDMIDRKLETLNTKEKNLDNGQKALIEKEKSLADKDKRLDSIIEQKKSELLKVARISVEEARKQVIMDVRKEMEVETARMVNDAISEAKESSEEKSREILLQAIQRYASDQASEHTTSVVDVPSDDMKGRIIGREGRNIRAFERATGVDVIVDDTPGVIVCSAFDPIRREIASRSMEKLIQDGRIHPTRIEEIVSQISDEINKEIATAGKEAAMEVNVSKLHPKLVDLLGRLKFRTSYGQNVLQHSIEVARLSQVIADQLNLKGNIARRAGLFHDIGKAVDHEVEGGHPEIGADLLRRYKEREEIINAAAGHHNDVEATTPYTPIVLAADAISASRPGARRESLEKYIQRLDKLEKVASAFEGVKTAYAIQAGREVRVIVDPENVDDQLSNKMARDIAAQIEEEMEYPGEIVVTLVRELRCVEHAR